jgi:hypothetical protein
MGFSLARSARGDEVKVKLGTRVEEHLGSVRNGRAFFWSVLRFSFHLMQVCINGKNALLYAGEY